MASNQTISQTEDGIRLKRWVKRHYPKMSEGEFHKLCRSGQIRLNGKRCRGDEILNSGDALRIPPFLTPLAQVGQGARESGIAFSLHDLEKLRQRIIHDDPDFVAFDKPAGLAVQGGTGIKKSLDKMAAALFPYDTVLPVHRLDRETSGVIIFAKNQRAAQNLSAQFQNREATKEYLALLRGRVFPKSGIIDNYIKKGIVVDDAPRGEKYQRAVTRYKVLGELTGILAWVQFLPMTGRTHQLRLHSAFSLNAPIVGDSLYGKQDTGERIEGSGALDSLLESNKLFLFAHRLSFRHPITKKIITIRAQMPDFMANVAKFLELGECV